MAFGRDRKQIQDILTLIAQYEEEIADIADQPRLQQERAAEAMRRLSEKQVSEILRGMDVENVNRDKLGLRERDYNLQPLDGDANAVQYAIEMINAGKADCLMRGNTQTRDFLMPVLNKANHLIKPDALVTHVVFLKVPDYDRLLAISDVTLLINPSADGRKQVAVNMVRALKVFGVEKPNIALLSLVEKPSFQMRDTVEDQTMVREHQYRPIADCNLAGPIAYDLIMSKEAARLKGYDCPWCGEFDGIVVPNLMSGNLLVKVLQHNAGATGCGILVGAKIPVAICSRSDDPGQAYLSLAACAAMWASGKYF